MYCAYITLFILALACDLSCQEHRKPYNDLDGLYEKPTTWIAGENPFPATLEEMRQLLGVKQRNKLKFTYARVKVNSDVKLPKSFDARKHWPECGIIKTIYNQGRCGSCWAVSAANSFTDRLCIASKGNISVSLSFHQLTTCCYRCGYGCDGGLPELAFEYFKRHGLVTGGAYLSREGCQPYNVFSDRKCYAGKCTNSRYKKSFKEDLHKTSSVTVVDNDEEAIKSEIYNNGPVIACFDVYSDFLRYKSGVYKQTQSATFEGGHAVRVIGWGEENGDKYWLCANSWGYWWGESGTFKILRGTNECQIEDRVIAGKPIVKE